MSDIQDNISGINLPDNLDDILTELQGGLDVNVSPFNSLAQKLGMDANLLIKTINQLLDDGIIREISPVISARKLGYASTLAAASVPESVVPDFVKRVNQLAGVSHNYARAHHFNVWFTLTVPQSIAEADPFEPVIESLKTEFGINEIVGLPSMRMYKLKVQFGSKSASGDSSQSKSDIAGFRPDTEPIIISDEQKQLIRELQKGIPVVEFPFDIIAQSVNQSLGRQVFCSDTIVELLQSWHTQGAIRRIAGRVRHHKVGYQANAMVVFKVDKDKIDQAGQLLATKPCVSHCYHRKTNEFWQYNLYAMTHAKRDPELQEAIADMVNLISPDQHEILYTLKEYKKEAVKYFV